MLDRRSILATVGTTLGSGCTGSLEDPPTNDEDADDTDSPLNATTETDDRDPPPSTVGAVYIPFNGDKWNRCAPTSLPAVGRYEDTSDEDIVNAHIDQMTDHGISRVLFNFGEEDADYDRWNAFTSASAFADIEVECYYVIHQAFKRGRDLATDFAFVREEMFSVENYTTTTDGRPVVTFWWMKTPFIVEEYRDAIEAEHGSLVEFVHYLRAKLTVDGVDPYLVADFNALPYDGYSEWLDLDAVAAFDATTNWFGHLQPESTVEWADKLAEMENIYRHARAFAVERGIDFVPLAFPGFDDRANDCWGEDRLIPRDANRFEDLLALADEYRTTDRVMVATFNGWSEGHQIEAGSRDGEEYGTKYLETVSEFVDRADA